MKPIDSDDIYHLSGPDGVRSYLTRKPTQEIIQNVVEYLPYTGPWQLYKTMVGEDEHVMARHCWVKWATQHIVPDDWMAFDFGKTSDIKSKSLFIEIDCRQDNPAITALAVSPYPSNREDVWREYFLIGLVRDDGSIVQLANSPLYIMNRWL